MTDNTKAEQIFKIKQASLDDMSFLLSMAEQEGWNPGLHDAVAFYAADPAGFFYGELEGKKIGCVSAVRYSSSYGFLGFYVIHPEYREQRLGYQLGMRAREQFLNQCLGLDARIEQVASFEKLGFKLYFKNRRYQGMGGVKKPEGLTEICRVPLEAIVHYDAPIFGAEREAFLEKWITMPNAHGFTVMEGQNLKGYGMIRTSVHGWRIGPLFADDRDTASLIFHGLMSQVPHSSVYIDVPEINTNALEIVENYGMKKNSETFRMYTEAPPSQAFEKMFGITSTELG
ncbi:MAG: GNAT family N-acetyltransferase [Chlamydiales bacterium]|nr:GNAT family N-acetyltransferase [Chlamydiia bacterium]MCP5508255.1 GNAT family N-acetyltransferase [Chlamydiales bacterium]